MGLCAGQPVTDPGRHQPEVSGVGAQAIHLGARPPRLFVSVHPGIRPANQCVRPPGVSVVGVQTAKLVVRQLGFR